MQSETAATTSGAVVGVDEGIPPRRHPPQPYGRGGGDLFQPGGEDIRLQPHLAFVVGGGARGEAREPRHPVVFLAQGREPPYGGEGALAEPVEFRAAPGGGVVRGSGRPQP